MKLNAPVVVKKKGLLKGFIENDWQTIKFSVFNNVIKPGIKTFIANVIYGFTNATLFKGGPVGYGNYFNYYQQGKAANLGWSPLQSNAWNALKPGGTQQVPSMVGGGMTSLSDYKSIEFNSIEDAQFVYNQLVEKIVNSGKANVRFMFDKCNLSSNDVTLDNWGWYDLACGFQITPLANGRYHLNLPEPVNFNIQR